MTIMKALLAAAVALSVPAVVEAQDATQTYEPLPSIALPAELDRVLRDYEAAWTAGDENALAALFTSDGFVPTSVGWIRGRDGIRRVYENSSGPLRLRALAFHVDQTAGYIVGAYNYGDPAGGVDAGKFLLAIRQDRSGRWLIAADLDNGNRPPVER
jgi:ketosteroid isomerase-like protein